VWCFSIQPDPATFSVLSFISLILALFKQYGSFFKTHRLYRHYVYALFAPSLLLEGKTRWDYSHHIEHNWRVHAARMNQQMLMDPDHTYYPDELKLPLRNY
jgi:hypothetical protein